MPDKKDDAPWFSEGLQFSCQPGCRRCCGGSPGFVWVSEEEIARIAAHMKLSVKDFELSYIREMPSGRKSIRELRNYDCILLDEKGCSVYEARPQQCRTYPFWPELLDTQESWESETKRCPGINVGETHAAPKLIDILKSQKK
jgi:Fe-S-cluster containining protein